MGSPVRAYTIDVYKCARMSLELKQLREQPRATTVMTPVLMKSGQGSSRKGETNLPQRDSKTLYNSWVMEGSPFQRREDFLQKDLMQSLSRVWSFADLCICRQLGHFKFRRKGESAKRVFPSRLFESNTCDAAGSYGIDISTPGRG